jgi:hypothetical protein
MLRSRASVNFKRLTERPHFIRSKRPTERPHLLAHKKRNLAGLERNAAALGIKGLNELVKRKIPVPTDYQTPSGADFGIATKSTMEILRKTDYYKLKPGLRCSGCFSPTFNLFGAKKSCRPCFKGCFSRLTQTNNKIPAMKKEMRKSTNQPLHHLAYIARKSGGQAVSQQSFIKLNKFAVKWMKLTQSKTHKTNVIDCFAGRGSGLASYETMTQHCTPEKNFSVWGLFRFSPLKVNA